MGFYGHITNVQRTSMSFDKIYSNRFTMDESAKNDGVYAGRYVLIEYERPLDKSFLPRVIQFDGLLYQAPPERMVFDPNNADFTTPNSYLVRLETYTINMEAEEPQVDDVVGTFLRPDLIAVCSVNDNLGVKYDQDANMSIGSVSKLQYFRIGKANNAEKESYNLFYNYKTQKIELDAVASRELKTSCSYTEVNYSALTSVDDSNYLLNFNIDNSKYTTSRGYDSTVWQKTYVSGEAKYVMIAELNSVVPILDVSADAPTLAPIMPHFDKDSTNIYYKLHMQPSWGFRIKGANPNLTIPTIDYSGSVITDGTGIPIVATSDAIEYPSDQKTEWFNTVYKDNNYTNYYLNEYIKAEGDKSVEGRWEEKQHSLDGAIYFNRAGFDKEYITHSKDYKYTNRDLTLNPLVDEITLAPTGFSGHLYPTHTTDNINVEQPDVNELAVLLPSIGDTIADVWDLIYGGEDLNTIYDGKGLRRNLVIRWEDAKKVLAKEGLRLVRADDKGLGYTYNPEEVNTLAGVINSVQDIMGMIITNDYPEDDIDNLNEDYIYYNPTTGKYYFKKRTYTYEKIEGEVSHEKVDLVDWKDYQDNSWWVDTNSTTPDYIQESTFRPEREYVQGVNVPTDKSLSRHFTRSDYEPGKYFLYREKDEGTGDTFRDAITKAPYIKYIKTYENYDVNQIYYDIEAEKVILNDDSIYYVPNKYYAGYFYPITPAIINEEDFENRLASGVRLFDPLTFTSEAYNVIEATELKSGDFNKISDLSMVYYLTLRTCSLTEEAFTQAQVEGRAPMLFTTTTFAQGSGVPQNYYVISKKYELFTDTQTVSASPGVYYQLFMEEGKTQESYLNGNLLKEEYVKNLSLDTDIIIEENCLYFREVVELILSSAENVVNIADAVQIKVEPLPKDLYKYYKTVIPGGIEEEGFRSISALSDEIATAKNYASITDLYKLTIRLLELGYEPNRYYYQELEGEYKNSVMIDNRLEPTPDRDYWTVNMVNKRLVTAAEILAGRKANVVYYQYDADANDYLVYNGALIRDQKYYVSSLTDVPEIYFPNKYYYKDEDGKFILDLSPDFTPGREYYRNPQVYILNDPNGFYDKGAIWPLAQNPPEGSNIELATRTDAWELSELKGFDITFNTLHGLILRLNKWMLQDDWLTRDDATLQGALNQLNDIIHRIGELKPGQLMIVDNTGRMRGVSYSTKQEFSAVNHGGQAVTVKSTQADPDNEDMWIDIDTDDDYRDPKLTIKHNFTAVHDTTSTSNMNTPAVDKIDLYTPIVDATGHVVGKNTETVTLPFGFKTLAATNEASETLSQSEVVANSNVVAKNTQDILTLKAKNKWIEFTTDNNGNSITIAHRARNEMSNPINDTVQMDAATLENGRNILGPVLADVGYDPAGHLISRTYTNFKLPNGYQTFQSFTNETAHMSIAKNAHDVFTFYGDDWIKPLVEQDKITFTHSNDQMTQGFTPAGSHVLDSQEPQFGETFNMQTYTLDGNGHIIGKSTETVLIPTNIQGLLLTTFDDLQSSYIKKAMTLEEALATLDNASQDIQDQIDDNYAQMQEGYAALQDVIDDEIATLRETLNEQNKALLESDAGLAEAIAEQSAAANETYQALLDVIDEQSAIVAETYAPVEGNINQDTDFLYKAAVLDQVETLEDGTENIIPGSPEVRVKVQEAVEILSNLDTKAIHADQTFIYTPEVVEESHEATQEEVDAGLATALGDKIIDVEHVPAEELTIQELFTKVKALETLLNSLTI